MTALFSIMLPLLVLFCGLSLDVGLLEMKKLQMQSAADAAAISAEQEAERGTGNWVSVATSDAASNGFTNGSNNVTVSISQQPTYGTYAGRYDALQATISQKVQTIFMGALKGGKVTISASSVSLMTPCVYLTGTGKLQAYTLDLYTGDWDGATCPINVNTNLTVTSWANMNVEASNVSGSASASSDSGQVYPSPNYGASTVTDPLSSISSPSFSSCSHTSYTVSGATATLNPGTYCKGLTLTNSTVTLNPGLYVITGGATWTSSTVTGTGVTLFFTQGGGGSYGQFKMNSSTVTMSAPTSTANGGVTGVLVFADRNWTATGAQDFQCNSSTFTGDGIWYLTNAGLYLWSCGTFTGTNYLGLVADNAYSAGTSFIPKNNYTGISGGNPFRTQAPLVQ